jgi:AcrR family transcriptional regulator
MTEQPKEDRRKLRTKRLLREALMALMLEKDYTDITLQDITDRADVSRTTFYLHYQTKDELLYKSMEDLYNEMFHTVKSATREEVLKGELDWATDSTDFKHVADNAGFYRVVLGEKGVPSFIVHARQYLAEMLKEMIEGLAPKEGARLPNDFMAYFLAGAEIGVLTWWLNHLDKYTPDDIAVKYYQMAAFGLLWALKFEEEEGFAPKTNVEE